MFTIHPLYSSSSGNMFHIACSDTNILIDIGVSYKAIRDGLKSINLSLEDIDAIIITHEHTDHIKGLPLLCRKNNIPIYTCSGTAKVIKELLDEKNIDSSNIISIDYNMPFKIKNIEIKAFETSHDAAMPCGFVLKADGSSISYATDLGFISQDVLDNLDLGDYIVLESNYDETMMDFGKYPFTLKRRIKSDKGHLSNDACGQAIMNLVKNGHTDFLLAHLSENNNTQEIAKQTIDSILLENNLNPDSVNINFASKKLSNEEYNI